MIYSILLKTYRYYNNEERKKFRSFLIYPYNEFNSIDDRLKNIIIYIYE